MNTESSFGLVARAKAGDASALERLILRYLPRLRRWTRRRLPTWARDMAETEDLVQETVFNAVRNLQHLDFKHEDSLKAYMRQAVRNRLRDEIKRAGRRPAAHPLLESDRSDDPSPREVAIAREDLLRCRAALARLPATDRRLILLRLSGGGSFRRLAALSGKPSANAARVALSRALARLAAEMHRLES